MGILDAMSDAPVVDLRDPRFDENKYGFIEELRSQNYFARTGNGDVLFLNQEDVIEVFKCEDFQFAFDNIDEERSPYLAEAIKHELLAMHGCARHGHWIGGESPLRGELVATVSRRQLHVA